MKRIFCVLLSLTMLFSFTACSLKTDDNPSTKPESIEVTEPAVPAETGFGNDAGVFDKNMTAYPLEYLTTKVENSNPVETVTYTHNGHQKKAIVYLPPNYNENEKYNVTYYLGGGKSNELAFFEADENGNLQFKNLMDNLVTKGELVPTIAVSLAFYPDDKREINADNIQFLLDNFADEMKTAIIPAVEGKYSTYALSTSAADIKASRKHRAFCGFSMGGNTAWIMLAKCLDYFYYFNPMSGGAYTDVVPEYMGDVPQLLRDALNEKNFQTNEYFVYAAVGEIDYTSDEMSTFVDYLKQNDDVFIFTNTDKSKGNISFKIMPDYHHEYSSGFCYACNAMNAFWGNK